MLGPRMEWLVEGQRFFKSVPGAVVTLIVGFVVFGYTMKEIIDMIAHNRSEIRSLSKVVN